MTRTPMPPTERRTTLRSETKREALLSVCASLRKKSIRASALAMAQQWQAQGAHGSEAATHWQMQSACWEAKAVAAAAREAAIEKMVSALSKQHEELAHKLSRAQRELTHLRNLMGLQRPQAPAPQSAEPSSGFNVAPHLRLADSQPQP